MGTCDRRQWRTTYSVNIKRDMFAAEVIAEEAEDSVEVKKRRPGEEWPE